MPVYKSSPGPGYTRRKSRHIAINVVLLYCNALPLTGRPALSAAGYNTISPNKPY